MDCGNPGDVVKIEHGDYEDFYSTTYNAVIKFSCDNKYMFEDAAIMTCQANGTWSQPPKCIGELNFILSSEFSAVFCGFYLLNLQSPLQILQLKHFNARHDA